MTRDLNGYDFETIEEFQMVWKAIGSLAPAIRQSWADSMPIEKMFISGYVDNDDQTYCVGQLLVGYGLLSRERMTPETLKVFNKYDNSIVAHELAYHGKFPPELLTADIAENCDVNGLAVLEYFLDFLVPKLKTDLGYVTDQFAKLPRETLDIIAERIPEFSKIALEIRNRQNEISVVESVAGEGFGDVAFPEELYSCRGER